MTVEEYLHPIDVKQSHILTQILDRKVPEADVWDVPFMPLKPFDGRRVKLTVKEWNGAGMAPFKADNANTPILEGGGTLQDIYIELVTIAEKAVLNATDLIELASPDNAVAKRAARNMVDLGVTLKRRAINRSRWMAWQAVKDALVITYPNNTSITVDWDMNADAHNDWMSGSHKPTAAVSWAHQDDDEFYDTNIIDDVYTWTKLIADDLGCDQAECTLHMNSTTWRYVRRNKWLRLESSPGLPQPRSAPVTVGEAADILDVAGVKIVNAYYLDDDLSRTKNYFLPDNYLLITGPYVWNGTPLAEMYDGLVARVRGGQIVIERNSGLIAETYINEEQVAENMRVQSARMPVVNYPQGFVYADLIP